MATDVDGDRDDQDQSEVFDEDNQDLGEPGGHSSEMRTFEELPDLLDMTHAVGDDDDEAALIAEELDDDDIIRLESDAELADVEDDPGGDDIDVAAGEAEPAMSRGADDEVELEFTGDLDELAVDGSGPASMEASDLSDEDLDDLGYSDED